jgi:hypothetical protein
MPRDGDKLYTDDDKLYTDDDNKCVRADDAGDEDEDDDSSVLLAPSLGWWAGGPVRHAAVGTSTWT